MKITTEHYEYLKTAMLSTPTPVVSSGYVGTGYSAWYRAWAVKAGLVEFIRGTLEAYLTNWEIDASLRQIANQYLLSQ